MRVEVFYLYVVMPIGMVPVDELTVIECDEGCLDLVHRARTGLHDGVLDGEHVSLLSAEIVAMGDQEHVEDLRAFGELWNRGVQVGEFL